MSDSFEFSLDGSFDSTEKWLKKLSQISPTAALNNAGRRGVAALRSATPVDSGETANAWDYRVSQNGSSFTLEFINTHINDGVNIAVIIDRGHGTRQGGYVRGRKFIAPSITPVFDRLIDDLWKEVTT